MAPFRSRDRSNRSGRGQVEHNVLEGLPINQYKLVEITVGSESAENKQVDKDAWPELAMPRDSHMLPEHSQQLLRAARAGRIIKPPAPLEEDRDDADEEPEHKEVQQGFTVKKYVKVARHLEEPEPEFLAKRRKGLPSQYAATLPTPMRETKVQKTDAEGNVNIYKVLVPEGQTVEGEVHEADVIAVEIAPAEVAPGTVVEGVGVVNAEGVVVANDLTQITPRNRRPPPPKPKKKKGRPKGIPGRKKKVAFAEGVDGVVEQGTPTSGIDLLTVPGAKTEEGSVEPSEGGDTPMPDAGDEEGSDESGSDEEREDGEMPVTPQPQTLAKAPIETVSESIMIESEEQSKVATPQAPPTPQAQDLEASGITEAEEPAAAVLEEVPAAVEPASLEAAPPSAQEAALEAAPEPVPEAAPEVIPEPTPEAAPEALPEVEALPEAEVSTEKKEQSGRDPSSSPELPLAIAHSRQNSLNQIPLMPLEPIITEVVPEVVPTEVVAPLPLKPELAVSAEAPASDSEVDLLGSLEAHLEGESKSMAEP
ncbi:hypothetical protein P154DRAFT_519817 [Amniculicola lignicola CBS 123094]|uniref:Uncharacterized protein n=1 Tax=Amniculicola lignicola CBS 123094 TaxID=1392246 RepID=A0A6A5WQW1_9PLEO|nr:hypothetical protein P154DRAFT_519817 [Amniculicola lignicola CBS 123094]